MKIRDMGVCRTNWDSPTFFFLSGLAANGFSSFSQFCAHCQGLESKPLSHKKQFVRRSTHTSLWGKDSITKSSVPRKKPDKNTTALDFFPPSFKSQNEGNMYFLFPGGPKLEKRQPTSFSDRLDPRLSFSVLTRWSLGTQKAGLIYGL